MNGGHRTTCSLQLQLLPMWVWVSKLSLYVSQESYSLCYPTDPQVTYFLRFQRARDKEGIVMNLHCQFDWKKKSLVYQ